MPSHIFLKIVDKSGKPIEGPSVAEGKHNKDIEIIGWQQRYEYEKVDEGEPVEPTAPIRTNYQDQMEYDEDMLEFARKKDQYSQEVQLWKANKLDDLKALRASARSRHPPLEFSKFVDCASPALMKASWNGSRFKQCTFFMYRPLGGEESGGQVKLAAADDYLQVELLNAYISDYQIRSTGDKWPTEDIKLQYDEVTFHFMSGDPSTQARRSPKRIHCAWKPTFKSEKK